MTAIAKKIAPLALIALLLLAAPAPAEAASEGTVHGWSIEFWTVKSDSAFIFVEGVLSDDNGHSWNLGGCYRRATDKMTIIIRTFNTGSHEDSLCYDLTRTGQSQLKGFWFMHKLGSDSQTLAAKCTLTLTQNSDLPPYQELVDP